ncbi:hypothetical protein [Escherichia coli]|uniref:hypothetical protein n=1 Tax=Escherichia coli TaxID=562 RepID=UPI00388F1082
MLAVAEKEGGSTGLENKNRNSNGTYDVGRMQFNTAYLKDLEKYGITAEDVAQRSCYSYDLAAWRIRGHIKMIKATSGQKLQIIIQKRLNLTRSIAVDLIRKQLNGRHGLKHALIRLMRQSLPNNSHSRNWRLQGYARRKGGEKHCAGY